MSVPVPKTERERLIWNAAVSAAAKVCRNVDQASAGQGQQMRPAPRINAPLRNPHGHRSGEISLGVMRCLTGIQGLRR